MFAFNRLDYDHFLSITSTRRKLDKTTNVPVVNSTLSYIYGLQFVELRSSSVSVAVYYATAWRIRLIFSLLLN